MSNTAQKLDTKGIWVYDSDVNVALLLIVEHNLLRFRNVYFGVSTEKTNIDSLLEFLGNESAKCLFTFDYLTGRDTVVKFQISKESRTKLFLQLNDQDIFKAFESLQGGHAKNYWSFTKVWWLVLYYQSKHQNLTTLPEVQIDLHK